MHAFLYNLWTGFHNLMQCHQFIWGLELGGFGPLPEDRWWGPGLVTGGDSTGVECIPLGAFKLVNSLSFTSAREVHGLLHLDALGDVLVMLANNWSSPCLRLLALEATEPAEETIKQSITK